MPDSISKLLLKKYQFSHASPEALDKTTPHRPLSQKFEFIWPWKREKERDEANRWSWWLELHLMLCSFFDVCCELDSNAAEEQRETHIEGL